MVNFAFVTKMIVTRSLVILPIVIVPMLTKIHAMEVHLLPWTHLPQPLQVDQSFKLQLFYAFFQFWWCFSQIKHDWQFFDKIVTPNLIYCGMWFSKVGVLTTYPFIKVTTSVFNHECIAIVIDFSLSSIKFGFEMHDLWNWWYLSTWCWWSF